MKLHKLCIDEYYDLMAIALCKAAKNYSSDISKFSTYAFYIMNNELKMEYRTKTRLKDIPKHMVVHYEEKVDNNNDNSGDTSLILNQLDSGHDTEVEAIQLHLIKEYISTLSERNKQIIRLLSCGYNQKEVAEMLNLSQSQISRIHKGLKQYILLN